jgi:hypothetical protein
MKLLTSYSSLHDNGDGAKEASHFRAERDQFAPPPDTPLSSGRPGFECTFILVLDLVRLLILLHYWFDRVRLTRLLIALGRSSVATKGRATLSITELGIYCSVSTLLLLLYQQTANSH